jgi:hypothetical protein
MVLPSTYLVAYLGIRFFGLLLKKRWIEIETQHDSSNHSSYFPRAPMGVFLMEGFIN